MSNFLKATRKKLRFYTTKGVLSVEDIWDLSLENLNTIAVALHKEIKEADEVSFISTAKKSSKDAENSLKFEIVKEIIEIKLAEEERRKKAAENKKTKDLIMEKLAQKKTEALDKKSEEELMKMLNDLDSEE